MKRVTIGKSVPMLLMSLAVAAAMPQSAERVAYPPATVAAPAIHQMPSGGAPPESMQPLASSAADTPSDAGNASYDQSYDDGASAADTSAPTHNEAAPRLDAQRLDDLVAPIALYPDDLVAIVLPASTFPLQVVEAQRFLERREQEPDATPDKSWDDSVVALLNYPDVLRKMDHDLDWTTDLGQAVMTDQSQVLDAIEQFRTRARTAGNLNSDDRQIVDEDRGAISIRSAQPDQMYVPYYEPAQVTIYQTEPVIYYYPVAFPV